MSPRPTRTVLVCGLIAAALIAGYFGLRSRTSTDAERAAASEFASDNRKSEPATSAAPEAQPPSRIAVTPSNAAAAFHSLQLCASSSRELAVTGYLSDCKPYEGIPDFQDLYAQCLNGWMNVPNRKSAAEAALKSSGCGDTTDVETRYFEATKRATQAGDADAQLCYLQGNFVADSGVPLFTDADVEEYGRVAPQFVDAALRRGDWRIVQLMTKRSFQPGAGPVTQIADIGKPETIYRMTKLLRLGASGRYASRLDRQLNGMIHPDLVPEAALPAEVVRRGDAWAAAVPAGALLRSRAQEAHARAFERECLRMWNFDQDASRALISAVLQPLRRYYSWQQKHEVNYKHGESNRLRWLHDETTQEIESQILSTISAALRRYFADFPDGDERCWRA